ncbi:hypothetical protein PVT71_12325 [Salipiger sp. H15]|uniref:Uncharacterized protein n=1 Tax=Alloyangia sp. H15 TaxID=3029062 RepID=A0AAU8AGD0_9RHOB
MIELAPEFPRTVFAAEEMAAEMLATYHTVHDVRLFDVYQDELTYRDAFRRENRARVAHYARIAFRRLQAGDGIDTLLRLGGAYDVSDKRTRIPTEDHIAARKAACVTYGCRWCIEAFSGILEYIRETAMARGQDMSKVPSGISLTAITPITGEPFDLQCCEDAKNFQSPERRNIIAGFMHDLGLQAAQNCKVGKGTA